MCQPQETLYLFFTYVIDDIRTVEHLYNKPVIALLYQEICYRGVCYKSVPQYMHMCCVWWFVDMGPECLVLGTLRKSILVPSPLSVAT